MTYQTLQIGSSGAPVLIWEQGAGSAMVINTNTDGGIVIINDDPSMVSGNLNSGFPLPSASFLVVDGSTDVYAVGASAGEIVTVSVIPGGMSFFQPASKLIASGPDAGVLIYSPSLGPGNLIGAWTSSAGGDSAGNTWPGGILLQPQSTAQNVFTLEQGGSPVFTMDAFGDIAAASLSSTGDISLAGTSLTTLLAGILNPDPWHPMTLLNGAVSGSSGNQFPSYQLDPFRNVVHIGGSVKITTNTVFARLPSGYFNPNTQVQLPIGIFTDPGTLSTSTIPYLQCDTSGNLTFQGLPASVTVGCIFAGDLPLDIPNSPTSGGTGSNKVTTTTTWNATDTYSYEGTNADSSPNPGFSPGALINHNGNAYQGDDQLGDNGNTSTFIVFPGAVQTALSGATINYVKITLKNLHSWFNSGMSYALGFTTATPGGGSRPAISNPAIATGLTTAEGDTHTYQISNVSSAFGSALAAGNALVMYNPTSSRTYYGYVRGGNQISITVNYTK